MSPRRKSFGLICLAVCVAILEGCSLGRQAPTRLYVLTPLAREELASLSAPTRDIAIGVGPVELPQYTSRPQIVTGNTRHELHSAQLAQWAEPLQGNFARVLAANLSFLLHTEHVTVFPWKGPMPIEYQVIVEVLHFLGDLGGETSLVALWSVVSKDGKEVLVSRKADVREFTRSQDYEALAAAMSRTIAALSRDIAAAITARAQSAAQR